MTDNNQSESSEIPSFAHLDEYKTHGKTAVYELPIRGEPAPTLTLRPVDQSNKGWFDAVQKRNAKMGLQRRLMKGMLRADSTAWHREQDRKLYPYHVVVDWEGIVSDCGKLVPFSPDVCAAFLQRLPDWIMDEIRNFACTQANFLEFDEPDFDEIQEQAGN